MTIEGRAIENIRELPSAPDRLVMVADFPGIDSNALFDRWMDNWRDLMDFEIVAVRTSTEAVELMKKKQ